MVQLCCAETQTASSDPKPQAVKDVAFPFLQLYQRGDLGPVCTKVPPEHIASTVRKPTAVEAHGFFCFDYLSVLFLDW